MAAVRHCRECNGLITSDVTACPYCGERVTSYQAAYSAKRQSITPTAQLQESANIPADTQAWAIECDICGFSSRVEQPLELCPECQGPIVARPVSAESPPSSTSRIAPLPPTQSSPQIRPIEIRRSTPRPTTPPPISNQLQSSDAPLEGIIRDRLPSFDEPRDPDWPMIVFLILLLADLILLGLTYAIVFLAIVAVILIIGMATGRGALLLWLLARPFGFVTRAAGGAANAAGRAAGRAGNIVPVVIYRVAPNIDHGINEFRLKGALQDTILAPGDYVRVWGPIHNGVVHFRRGERIDPRTQVSQPLQLPAQRLGWFLLFGLLILNALVIMASAGLL